MQSSEMLFEYFFLVHEPASAIVVSGIFVQCNILYYSRVFYRPRTPHYLPPPVDHHLRNAREQYPTIESYT